MVRRVGEACCLIVLAVTFQGCARSPEARRDKYLARGKEQVKKKNYSRAILEFKNAVQATPKDAEPYYQLGMAATGAGDLRTAILSYKKALDLDPKHAGAQLKLSQIMARASEEIWVKDAETRLKTLAGSSSSNPEVLNTLAFTELKLGKIGSAVENLEDVLEKYPGELTSSVLLARAKLLQNDTKGAEDVLKRARDTAPKSPDPHSILGEFYLSRNRMAEAEAEFRSALTFEPDNSRAMMNLARLQDIAGRTQEAESTLKHLASTGGSNKSVYARYLFEKGRRDEAVRELERLARDNRDDRVIRTELVTAYWNINRVDDARKVLDAALKANSKDQDALLQRAELLITTGKYMQAEEDMAYVLRLSPNSAEAHYVLAKAKQARGSDLTYRQELTEALRLNPHLLTVRLELANDLANHQEARAAIDLLDAAPEAQRTLIPLVVQRNWAFWSAGELAEMRKGVDAGLSRERSADLLLQDSMLKLHAGNPAAARAVLEELLNLDGTNVRALAVLSQTYIAQKQTNIALQKVKEHAARQSKSAPVQEFLGMLLFATGDRRQARAAFEMAKAADPRFVRADLSLVQLDVADGKIDDAHRRLETILAANSSNTQARVWLADVLAMKRDNNAALEQFRQVVAADPNNPQALNNYAFLLAEYANRPLEALKYAQKAQELRPGNAEYRDTLGWILYLKGLYPLAVAELERAVSAPSKNPNPVWKYHLAMAYGKAGKMANGRATLEAALKANPNLPEAKLAQSILGTIQAGPRP
jgi:tetratricopeptide (TPR) repeat protein